MDVSKVVELRVHGVSGTPPEELLDRALVSRVGGDGTAGFYRPTLYAERTDSFPAGSPEPAVHGPQFEGYAWGGLTSGVPSRAFWLVLLPFSLINVAPRLRPGDPPEPASDAARRRLWLIWFISRLLALVLTVVLVCAFVGIGVDLIGWQCGGHAGRCRGATPGWLMNRIVDKSTPHRLAIGGLLPLLALFTLWFVSWRSMRKTELTDTVLSCYVPDDDPDATEVGLASKWMWDNTHPVRRLRGIHLQTGVAVTLAFVSATMRPAVRWIDFGLAVGVSGYAIVALCLSGFVGHAPRRLYTRISAWMWLVLSAAGIATFATLLFDPDAIDTSRYTCHSDSPGTICLPSGSLPGYNLTLVSLLVGEIGVVAVLLLVVRSAARATDHTVALGEPGPSAGLAGRGTSVLTLMAVFLASVFTSAAYLFGASWLDAGTIKPNPSDVSAAADHFSVPEVIRDAGLAYFVAVLMAVGVFVGFGVWAWLCLRRITPTSPLVVAGSYAEDYPGTVASSSRGKSVLTAMWLGRVVDVAGRVLGILMVIGAVLTTAFGVVLVLEHAGVHGVDALARRLSGQHTDAQLLGAAPETFQGLGAYFAVWTLLLLVGLGALAFRVQATRRSVGILWDLASFWPRIGHPLAPPCYAERTVPDLVTRIRWHAGEGRGVVVAAHSQGTVISAATMLQLHTVDTEGVPYRPLLREVGLLTFGCVLRRLYGRYFPAYFGPHALLAVRSALATSPSDQRWRNLWRYTDYLGGPVMSGPPPTVAAVWTAGGSADPAAAEAGAVKIDAHLRDPQFGIAPGDTVYPPPGRHSDFWKVPEFQQAIRFLASRI
ncbi:MAG: hypothetical protein ACRDVG_01985 [Jatrophihabitantaceae bacterium]